jgi:phosphoribosylaminoimidazole-succinocarboxamide synthase
MELREIVSQLKYSLERTALDDLGARYEGKVRDCYANGERTYLITTDRLSCFDRVVTTIPFKGEVLTALAVNWFKKTSDIIDNHIIDLPDPNVMVVKPVEILPIEVVVRGYLAGSAWRDYAAGRAVSGIDLPKGLNQYQKLPKDLLTPSTKAPSGTHDEPISEEEIIGRGIVPNKLWQEIRNVALALFKRGSEIAGHQGLILVDTKYEFGLSAGRLILADEIHTLDSSRYWVGSSYQQRVASGEAPEMLDKEPVRQWLLSQGFKGDGPIPHFSDEKRVEIAAHYIFSFERVTGERFVGHGGDVATRIASALQF